MIILDSVNKSLEVVLDATITTNQLPIVTAFADHGASSFTPSANDTITNNTTAVTIVAAPGASTQRQVKYISIYNADTASALVTARLNNNSTLRILVKILLSIGDTLTYTDRDGWIVITSDGQIKTGEALNLLRDISGFRHTGGSSLEVWYWASCISAGDKSTTAFSAGNLRAVPFVSPSRLSTIDRLGFNVTASVASSNARIGIYKNIQEAGDNNIYPGDLIFDSGDISTATTGVKTATLSANLKRGVLYWLVILSSHAPTLRSIPVAQISHILGTDNSLGTFPNSYIISAFAFGALPNPFPAGGSFASAPLTSPALGFRFSA